MTAMVKDLGNLDETDIRREEMMTRLGLCGAVVGRGGSGMRKGQQSNRRSVYHITRC